MKDFAHIIIRFYVKAQEKDTICLEHYRGIDHHFDGRIHDPAFTNAVAF